MTRKWRDNSLVQLVRLFLIDEVVNAFTFGINIECYLKWIERNDIFSKIMF